MSVQWLRDDRSPSAYTRLYIKSMWRHRDKAAFEGEEHTRQVALQQQRRGDSPPGRWTRWRWHVERQDGAFPTWTVQPRGRTPIARIVYFHGGGYVHPLTHDYWRLIGCLADAPAEVVVPAYRLAPAATVDDVLPDLVRTCTAPSDAGSPLPLVLMGDSAGGALSLVVATVLRDRGGPTPAGVVGLSPWLDATLREEDVAGLESSDPMLAESGLRAAGRWWAGTRSPSDPLVSPVNASLGGLPPLDVFIGSRDILRPAVDLLARRAASSEVSLTVYEVSQMFHVWMTRAIPEARRTRQHLRELVRDRAGGPPH